MGYNQTFLYVSTLRLFRLNFHFLLCHNAVLMLQLISSIKTWYGQESVMVWPKISVLVVTLTGGDGPTFDEQQLVLVAMKRLKISAALLKKQQVLKAQNKMGMSPGSQKKHLALFPLKPQEISPGVLKQIQWCDSNSGRQFGSLVGL